MDIRRKQRSNVPKKRSDFITHKKYRAGCGEMTSGPTPAKMKMEIQSLHIDLLEIKAVYGFGSFFREEASFNDIDLLVIISISASKSVDSYYKLKREFDRLAHKFQMTVDLTVLTEKEFRTGPLRDMHQLQLLI